MMSTTHLATRQTFAWPF